MDKPMNRIKEVLEERGIKQTWLAEKLGRAFAWSMRMFATGGLVMQTWSTIQKATARSC